MALRSNLSGGIVGVAFAFATFVVAAASAGAADTQTASPEPSSPSQVAVTGATAAPSAPDAAAPEAEPAAAKPTMSAAPDPAKVAAGREVFNGTCAHCHGPDAAQSERRINLRLLQQRYGDKMDEVFHYTVTHGRIAKGMPNWTGVFTEDDFANILAFLHTVQSTD